MSFAKNINKSIAKNISKTLSRKTFKNVLIMLNILQQMHLLKLLRKTAEATGNLIVEKITNEITRTFPSKTKTYKY